MTNVSLSCVCSTFRAFSRCEIDCVMVVCTGAATAGVRDEVLCYSLPWPCSLTVYSFCFIRCRHRMRVDAVTTTESWDKSSHPVRWTSMSPRASNSKDISLTWPVRVIILMSHKSIVVISRRSLIGRHFDGASRCRPCESVIASADLSLRRCPNRSSMTDNQASSWLVDANSSNAKLKIRVWLITSIIDTCQCLACN